MKRKQCKDFLYSIGFVEKEPNYFHSDLVDVDLRDDDGCDFNEIAFIKDSIILDYIDLTFEGMVQWMLNHKIIVNMKKDKKDENN